MEESKTKTPFLIGLSGQSCAGKNEATLILKQQGIFCIDADEISRRVFSENESQLFYLFHNEAKERGFDICLKIESEKPRINKKNFALFVFSDSTILKRHEAFILPKIENKIEEKIKKAFIENPNRPILINAPTLHKTSFLKKCKFIIYITAPILIRIFRAKKRDHLPLKNILARFSRQCEFFSQYFFKDADTIIVKNFGSLERLKKTLLKELERRI